MIQELRREHDLTILLEVAQLPKATYYYHRKKQNSVDKYALVKTEIQTIFHENKGRYGYRRITAELHNRGFSLNHKTVQRLMKDWRKVEFLTKYAELCYIRYPLLIWFFCTELTVQLIVRDFTHFSLIRPVFLHPNTAYKS